jgi:hypothetical protein
MRLETFNDKLTFFGGAFAAWTVLFLFVNFNLDLDPKLGKRKINDIKNRAVSIVHGLFALFVSGYHIYRDNPQYAEPASNIQHVIMLTSCAYFLYDFIACAYYGLADTGLVLHHAMCLIGIGSSELMNNATTALMGLFFAEVSNFPMHFRCILRTFKMRYTKLYELSEVLYIITYIIARGIGITYLTITAVPVSETPIVIRLTCLGLWAQSLYFVYEMNGILQRKTKHYKERCDKDISYNWFGDNEKLGELSYYRKEGADKIF